MHVFKIVRSEKIPVALVSKYSKCCCSVVTKTTSQKKESNESHSHNLHPTKAAMCKQKMWWCVKCPTKGFPLTSPARYAPDVFDGSRHVFLCGFDEGVLPCYNLGIKSDESKVVFPVEVIQNGRQGFAGLREQHIEVSRDGRGGVWVRVEGRLETVSPAGSSVPSLNHYGRSQTPHSLGPWADWVARRSAQSVR